MKGKKKNNIIAIIIFLFLAFWLFGRDYEIDFDNGKKTNDNVFRIISSTSTSKMDDKLIKYGKKNGIKVEIEHYGDLEIVDILNNDSKPYDAVWISNSLWLYMLDNSYLTTDSKSIVIDPVVMGITKSKAEELGFIDKEIYNKDILNAIRDGKLKYIMASVTKTNTGATSYLSFLNSMAGSPEVLTEEMIESDSLKNDLKDFFKGVERVSGDELYLTEMYNNGDYNAMINYESSLIEINQSLVKQGKEPLYLIYPVDGVAINDMPFAYINNDSTDEKNKEKFLKLQSYLRSDDAIELMQEYGYRSWYGGTNEKVDKKIFNPEWGIDTTKYLKDMKYPSKKVITKAISLYIESFRKPHRDPREDAPLPILKSDVLTIDDVKIGMELTGTVRNVLPFGLFIDVGLHNDGLAHISHLSKDYVKDPSDLFSVGDIVTCYVIGIDKNNEKISLSLLKEDSV